MRSEELSNIMRIYNKRMRLGGASFWNIPAARVLSDDYHHRTVGAGIESDTAIHRTVSGDGG